MKVTQLVLPLCLVFLGSCGNEVGLKDDDTVSFPDTAAFKNTWKMQERTMLNELFTADTFYNPLGLDTFELSYSMCDCPDWIDRTKGDIDCKECTDFYIEPADSSLKLPGDFHVSGNTVRFYGVIIPAKVLPAGREFTVPNPPPWTVIRYYGYEVVRPYKIWGPRRGIDATVRLTIR